MTLSMKLAEEREEGRREGQKEMICSLLSSGMSPEEIAERTGIPLDEVEAVEKSMCVSI